MRFGILSVLAMIFFSQATFAQRTTRLEERIQQTYISQKNLDVAGLLRIHPLDVHQTELRSLQVTASSLISGNGSLEIYLNGRSIHKLHFKRFGSSHTATFPMGTRFSDLRFDTHAELTIDLIRADVVERRFAPAPRPQPPRYEPAPRPRPPRHEPAPRPQPPRQGPRR